MGPYIQSNTLNLLKSNWGADRVSRQWLMFFEYKNDISLMGICYYPEWWEVGGHERSHKEGVRKCLVDSGDFIGEGGQFVQWPRCRTLQMGIYGTAISLSIPKCVFIKGRSSIDIYTLLLLLCRFISVQLCVSP